MVAGLWVTVDFDSKYKILWDATKAHGGTYIFMKKTMFKTRIYIIIPTPYSIRLKHVGVEGGNLHYASQQTV